MTGRPGVKSLVREKLIEVLQQPEGVQSIL